VLLFKCMKMTPTEAQLCQENAAQRGIIEELKAQVTKLLLDLDQLRQDNVVLRLKVDAMARRLFGKSSEKLDPTQLQMVFDALDKSPGDDATKKPEASGSSEEPSEAEVALAATAPGVKAKRKKRSFEQLVDGLRVVETIVDPQEVQADPEAWVCIGAEVTKLIGYEPGKFHAEHIIRRKFVSKEDRHLPPITAPLLTLQERCIATPELLAHTLCNRFELHLPFYRIEAMYARQGLPIPRQTLCGWAGMAHDATSLIMKAIKREVFADGYVQIDEPSGAR